MRDAEAVRLVAHMLDEVQGVGAAVQPDGILRPVGQIDFLVLFRKADRGSHAFVPVGRNVSVRLQEFSCRESIPEELLLDVKEIFAEN
mgnify:CR=1 FL=1